MGDDAQDFSFAVDFERTVVGRIKMMHKKWDKLQKTFLLPLTLLLKGQLFGESRSKMHKIKKLRDNKTFLLLLRGQLFVESRRCTRRGIFIRR